MMITDEMKKKGRRCMFILKWKISILIFQVNFHLIFYEILLRFNYIQNKLILSNVEICRIKVEELENQSHHQPENSCEDAAGSMEVQALLHWVQHGFVENMEQQVEDLIV